MFRQWVLFFSIVLLAVTMSLGDEQFTQLMNALTATKEGTEALFSARLDKLQWEVEASQATSCQEV